MSDQIIDHAENNRGRSNSRRIIVIVMPAAGVILAAALVFFLIVNPRLGIKEYRYEGHVIRYTSEISEADLAATAAGLMELGLFTPGETVFKLKLQKKGSELQLLFPVKKGAVGSQDIQDLLFYIESQMNNDPYFCNSLRVIQSDENLNPIE